MSDKELFGADEFVMVKKTTKEYGHRTSWPLWQFLEMTPEHIKYEIDRAARDLGYFGMKQNADYYGAPRVMVHIDMVQPARVTEGGE